MNNLNKLPLGVDFTAGGLQITNHRLRICSKLPNLLRIYSANFLQCMNVLIFVTTNLNIYAPN
jgi:hypothetical protein